MRINKVTAPLLLFVYILFFSQGTIFAQDANVQKSEIYSKLKCCLCKVSFDKCTCTEAKEMKAYIDALIETGLSKDEIFYKVAKKFSLKVIMGQEIKSQVEKRLIKEAGEKRPQIVLEPASFDFGAVNRKQKNVSKIFKLSNNGNDVLVVKSIKTSCPCTLAALKANKKKTPYYGTEGSPADWKAEVKPQDSAELEVMLDLVSPHIKNGKVTRDVTVTSNDPLYPKMTVNVEAVVED